MTACTLCKAQAHFDRITPAFEEKKDEPVCPECGSYDIQVFERIAGDEHHCLRCSHAGFLPVAA